MVPRDHAEACAHLTELLDRVTEDRETVLITRRGAETVAMIAADELEALHETVHLLRSPANAERLLTWLARAKAREEAPTDLEALKAELGLARE